MSELCARKKAVPGWRLASALLFAFFLRTAVAATHPAVLGGIAPPRYRASLCVACAFPALLSRPQPLPGVHLPLRVVSSHASPLPGPGKRVVVLESRPLGSGQTGRSLGDMPAWHTGLFSNLERWTSSTQRKQVGWRRA